MIVNVITKYCFGSSDIDECDQGKDDCERDCVNRIGTYVCRCPPGFELNADNVTCKGNKELFSRCPKTSDFVASVCLLSRHVGLNLVRPEFHLGEI